MDVTAGEDVLALFEQNVRGNVSSSGQLRSYGRLKLIIEGKDY
jgi:hypothetical protein